jgi:TonB family protein
MVKSPQLLRTLVCTLLFVSTAAAPAEPPKGTTEVRSLNEADVRRLVVRNPMPRYPMDARIARLTGRGLFRIAFDTSGKATGVQVVKSTGHQALDSEAMRTLRLWRIRANTGCDGLTIPVIFRL